MLVMFLMWKDVEKEDQNLGFRIFKFFLVVNEVVVILCEFFKGGLCIIDKIRNRNIL